MRAHCWCLATLIGAFGPLAAAQPSVNMGPSAQQTRTITPSTAGPRPMTSTGGRAGSPLSKLQGASPDFQRSPFDSRFQNPSQSPSIQTNIVGRAGSPAALLDGSPRDAEPGFSSAEMDPPLMGAARLRDLVDNHRAAMQRLYEPGTPYPTSQDATVQNQAMALSAYRFSNSGAASHVSLSSGGNGRLSWTADLNASIAAYAFLDYRYGRGCVRPDRALDGFIAEPVMLSDLYASAYGVALTAPTWASPATSQPVLVQADDLFAAGDPEGAIPLYEEHLTLNPDDFGVRVRLGLAMLESGNASDAVAVLHHAYASDPSLADVSLAQVLDGWSASRLRAMVAKSVSHANRTESASGWMVVALLMEAEGRAPLAERMLERATSAGLDRALATRIAARIAQTK